MFLNFSVFITLVCFLYHYFTKSFNYWKDRNVKGPKPIPLFGNFYQVALRKKPKGMFYREIYNQYPEEKVIGIYQMTSPTLIIRDLDIVKQIMIKDFDLFPDRGTYFSKEGLGENIFHSDANTWKFLRNQFTTLFTSSKVKNTFHLLADRGEKFVEYIDNATMKCPEQDVYQLLLKYTVSTSLVAILGWNFDTFNDNNEWYHVLDQNLDNSRLIEMDMLFPGILNKLNLTILAEKTINICHQIVKACLDENNISNNINVVNAKDLFIHLKNESKNHIVNGKDSNVKITDDLLAGQAWVFFTAGYINNNLSLTYALYHLACNPHVQEKLRDEIDEIMNKHKNELNYEILKEMKYLGMVFEETLRMHPLTHGLVRSASEDVKIEGTDIIIEKGTTVVVPSYSIQHDEKYYTEPEKFNPDRFLPENVVNQHPCAFLTFGVGRRSCLGTQFARIQFGIGIVKILQRFRVETTINTCSNITFDCWHMLLKPEPGIRLLFVSRET